MAPPCIVIDGSVAVNKNGIVLVVVARGASVDPNIQRGPNDWRRAGEDLTPRWVRVNASRHRKEIHNEDVSQRYREDCRSAQREELHNSSNDCSVCLSN